MRNKMGKMVNALKQKQCKFDNQIYFCDRQSKQKMKRERERERERGKIETLNHQYHHHRHTCRGIM